MPTFSRKFSFVKEKNLHFDGKFIAKGNGDDEIYLLSITRSETSNKSLFQMFMKVFGSPFLSNMVSTMIDKFVYVLERPCSHLKVSTFLELNDPFEYKIFNQMREALEFLHYK